MSHDAESADSLLTQLAQLRADLALARAVCDQLQQELREERARVGALVEACEVCAQFVEAYGPDSPIAQTLPTFYANLRVYGKNARAAVQAARPRGIQRRASDGQTALLRAAYYALQSYACGNSAPALAQEVAEHIEAAIGKVGD